MTSAPEITDFNAWILSHESQTQFWQQINERYTHVPPQYDGIENDLQLPEDVHRRLTIAALELKAIYFDNSGLFVAPASFDRVKGIQKGVYTWIELSPNEILVEYAGMRWNYDTLQIYFATDPVVFLKKETYLFELPQDVNSSSNRYVLDPTDVNGNLYDIRQSHNIAPYFNEPPFLMSANCLVEWFTLEDPDVEHPDTVPGGVKNSSNNGSSSPKFNQSKLSSKKSKQSKASVSSKKKLSKLSSTCLDYSNPQYFLQIKTCSFINPFSELYILYESSPVVNGIGEYSLRDYLVGSKCSSDKTTNMISPSQVLSLDSRFIAQQQHRVHEIYVHSGNKTLEMMRELPETKEFKMMQEEFFVPEFEVVQFFKSSGSSKRSTRRVCKWSELAVIPAGAAWPRPYIIRARVRLPAHKKLPIFGIPLTSQWFSQYCQDERKYIISTKNGFVLGDPSYEPWYFSGGNGAFIWTWIQPVTDAETANMYLDVNNGYFVTARTIEVCEILTYVDTR